METAHHGNRGSSLRTAVSQLLLCLSHCSVGWDRESPHSCFYELLGNVVQTGLCLLMDSGLNQHQSRKVLLLTISIMLMLLVQTVQSKIILHWGVWSWRCCVSSSVSSCRVQSAGRPPSVSLLVGHVGAAQPRPVSLLGATPQTAAWRLRSPRRDGPTLERPGGQRERQVPYLSLSPTHLSLFDLSLSPTRLSLSDLSVSLQVSDFIESIPGCEEQAKQFRDEVRRQLLKIQHIVPAMISLSCFCPSSKSMGGPSFYSPKGTLSRLCQWNLAPPSKFSTPSLCLNTPRTGANHPPRIAANHNTTPPLFTFHPIVEQVLVPDDPVMWRSSKRKKARTKFTAAPFRHWRKSF